MSPCTQQSFPALADIWNWEHKPQTVSPLLASWGTPREGEYAHIWGNLCVLRKLPGPAGHLVPQVAQTGAETQMPQSPAAWDTHPLQGTVEDSSRISNLATAQGRKPLFQPSLPAPSFQRRLLTPSVQNFQPEAEPQWGAPMPSLQGLNLSAQTSSARPACSHLKPDGTQRLPAGNGVTAVLPVPHTPVG